MSVVGQYPRAARGADADGRPAATDLRAPRRGPRLRANATTKTRRHEESIFSSCFRVFVATLLTGHGSRSDCRAAVLQSIYRTVRARDGRAAGGAHRFVRGVPTRRAARGGRRGPAWRDCPHGLGRRRAATTSATCLVSKRLHGPARPWPRPWSSPIRSSPSSSPTQGADRQKELWLRGLAAGEAIGAFALSEPDAGTDAGKSADDGYVRAVRATRSGAGRYGWPTRKWRASRSSSRRPRSRPALRAPPASQRHPAHARAG